MRVLKNVFKIVWFISLFSLIFAFFQKDNLPTFENINSQLFQSPRQTELKQNEKKDIQVKYGEFEYKVTPVFNYELWGLVVSQHDSRSWIDLYHKNDPYNIGDVCVVWNENIKNGVYEQMKYSSGEWSCDYRYKNNISQDWFSKFNQSEGSNNHLLPKNNAIAKKIRSAAIGDQIHFKGYLANYTISKDGKIISGRNTSTVRTDTANGSCEVVYITDFEIISPGNIFYHILFTWSKYILLVSTLSIIILFIAAPVE